MTTPFADDYGSNWQPDDSFLYESKPLKKHQITLFLRIMARLPTYG